MTEKTTIAKCGCPTDTDGVTIVYHNSDCALLPYDVRQLRANVDALVKAARELCDKDLRDVEDLNAARDALREALKPFESEP